MLGVLITLLFSVGAACFGHLLIRKLTPTLDVALRVGLCGLIGLGAVGTLTLFIGLVPGGLSSGGTWLVVLLGTASAALCARSKNYRIPLNLPKGPELLFVLALALAFIFALVSALAPSDMTEWDSLAYHLAVPKLWLQAGQIYPITFIHHSNFPFAIDNLYIWGLSWGGESGAKAFTLAFQIYGTLAIFGLTRQVYGQLAGWWATIAWTAIPAVLWLSGTAYIDVQNGLYAGLGILFAALLVKEGLTHYAWLSGIMLGLATGSKYTGLQTIFAVALVLAAAAVLNRTKGEVRDSELENRKSKIKNPAIVVALALLIAAPWYIKNTLWTGNPVYPFFYGQLGGQNWAKWNADIYQTEQQSFGVARATPEGKIEPQRIGHAILGLAYQPGRYINPGQASGLGFPIGAIGFVVVGSMLLWLISGRASPFESSILAITLVSFGMWFVLSEQSRYIIALGVPLSVLAGGAVLRLKAGKLLAGAIVVQALFTFYVVKLMRFDQQIQVVSGKVAPDEFMKATTPFYEPAQYLNQAAKGGRVALYDEVFGYLLDVPYFWANPGHTTELGYAQMQTADDLIAALKRKGITHVYVNLIPPGSSSKDPELQRWFATLGLQDQAQLYEPEERARKMQDLNWRAKILVGEAVATKKLALEKAFGSHLIFRMPN